MRLDDISRGSNIVIVINNDTKKDIFFGQFYSFDTEFKLLYMIADRQTIQGKRREFISVPLSSIKYILHKDIDVTSINFGNGENS